MTVCANANSASRLPRTGSTCVAGSSGGTAWRRVSHPAMASRNAGEPHRHGIIREARTAGAERIEHQARRRMLRLADRQADRALGGIGRDAGEQRAQPFERIGLQQRKTGIHAEGPCRKRTIIAACRRRSLSLGNAWCSTSPSGIARAHRRGGPCRAARPPRCWPSSSRGGDGVRSVPRRLPSCLPRRRSRRWRCWRRDCSRRPRPRRRRPTRPRALLRGDMRLLGVLAEEGGKGFALFRVPAGPKLVAAGQRHRRRRVAGFGAARWRHGARRRWRTAACCCALPLSRPWPRPATKTPPACTPPSGFKGDTLRLNAELVGGIIAQPEAGPRWRRRTAAR